MLFRYLLTYIGIAVAACAIVGTVLLTTATNELEKKNLKAQQERLSMACTDLANNLDTLENLLLRIKTEMEYQPFFLNLSPLNHVTMLESFRRFRNFSPLTDQYYLYYPDMKIVFTPEHEYPFYLFCSAILHHNEVSDIQNIIEQKEGLFTLAERPHTVFLRYLLVFRHSNTHSTAYMLFEIDTTQLIERYRNLYNLSNVLQITYRDEVLAGEKLQQFSAEVHQELSSGNVIGIRMAFSNRGTEAFQQAASVSILILTLAAVGLSTLLAWRSYLPIRGLVTKLNLTAQTDENEVKLIESVMDGLRSESRDTTLRLADSLERITLLTSFLQQQIVLQLLNGQAEEDWESHIRHCGMMLFRPFLTVILLQYQSQTHQEEMEELLSFAEESAVGEAAVYACRLPDQSIVAMIIAANEDEDITDYCESLPAMLYDEGLDCSVSIGKTVNTLKDLPLSFQAAYQPKPAREKAENEVEIDCSALKKAMAEGNNEKAQAELEVLMQTILEHNPSTIMSRYRMVELVYQVIAFSREINANIAEAEIKRVVLASDNTTLCNSLNELLEQILLESTENTHAILSQKNQHIMEFIDTHSFDYAMCLDLVASEFAVSTKQVSRVVKAASGETFKDYLLRKRMEEAQTLLSEGMSPSEVTEKIGYSDVRYFKKRFHEFTGKSVVRYQKIKPGFESNTVSGEEKG